MGILTELNLFFQAKYILEKVLASSFFIWNLRNGLMRYSAMPLNVYTMFTVGLPFFLKQLSLPRVLGGTGQTSGAVHAHSAFCAFSGDYSLLVGSTLRMHIADKKELAVNS